MKQPVRKVWMAFGVAVVCLTALSPAGAQCGRGASPLAIDQGKFRVLVDGQAAGVEEFSISRSGSEWLARGNMQIGEGSSAARVSGRLKLRDDGSPIGYEFEWKGADGKKSTSAVLFQDGTAIIESQMAGANATVQFGASLGDHHGEGVMIVEVPRDSAAEKAGLKTGDLVTRLEGQPVKSVAELNEALRAKGDLGRFSVTVTREGETRTAQVRPVPFTQQFFFDSGRVVILDNNLYHHYAILVWLYDWEKRGAQPFNVLIPQDLTPGTVTVEATGQRNVGGTRFDVLRMSAADLEVELFVDRNKRLMRIEVPGSKAEVVRE